MYPSRLDYLKVVGFTVLAVLLIAVVSGTAVAAVILEDDFTGTVIDPAKWTTKADCPGYDCNLYASVTQNDSLILTVTRDNYVFAEAVSVMTFDDTVQSVECEVWQDATSSWQNWGAIFYSSLGSIGYYNVTRQWIVHWTGAIGESRSQGLSIQSMQPWQHFKLKIQLSGNVIQWLYDMDDGAGYRLAFSTTDFSLPYRTFWAGPGEVGKIVLSCSDPGTTYFDNVRVESELTELTKIDMVSPPDLSVLSAPPTFTWSPDAGTNNVFAVDASLSPSFTPYWSTYDNLHQLIYETIWTAPLSVWNRIPPGTHVYWRVRGADLDVQPLTIVTSDQVWSFTKQ